MSARPVMLLVVARWITSAGTTRKPARADSVTNGRGRVRTCAMRAASTTFQMRISATSRKSSSGRKANISAPDPGVAGDRGGGEAAHEHVERGGGERDVRCQDVHEREPAVGQGMNAHVTGIEEKHGGDRAVRSGAHDRCADRVQ